MINASHLSKYSSIDPLNTAEKMLKMLFDLGMTGQNIKNQGRLEVPEHMIAVVGRIMALMTYVSRSLKPEIMSGYLAKEN